MDGEDAGGWQGRVMGIEGEGAGGRELLITVEWDSLTLMRMRSSYIDRCEEEGLSWLERSLPSGELEPAEPRDTFEDVGEAIEKVYRGHRFSYLGEEGRRINGVLAGVDEEDREGAMGVWMDHLREMLAFPFEAEVTAVRLTLPERLLATVIPFEVDTTGYHDEGLLCQGDKVNAESFDSVDGLYGLIAEVQVGHKKLYYPLCDLEVTDTNSPNYLPVKDYRTWFSNPY